MTTKDAVRAARLAWAEGEIEVWHPAPDAPAQLAGTITGQLDLSWKDAWRTESRGKHGEWETGAEAAIARLRAAFPPGKQAAAKPDLLPPGARSLMRKQAEDQGTGAGARYLNAHQAPSPAAALAAARAKIAEDRAARHAAMPPPPPLRPETVPKAAPGDTSPASAQLDADAASGITSAESPKDRARKAGLDPDAFGNSAQTSIVTFGNGSQWIRKRGLDADEMHREVLVSQISGVLGAGAPPVILRDDSTPLSPQEQERAELGIIGPRGRPQEMWEPLVPHAAVAAGLVGDPDDLSYDEIDPDDMYHSTQGAKIGILDTIADNYDRHPGNWMVQHDDATGQDTPVPIDHGHALMDNGQVARYGGKGPFGEALFADGRESEQLAAIPAAAWQKWIKGVTALRPQAKAYGMDDELNNVIVGLSNAADISDEAKYQLPNATGHPFTPDDVSKWTGATA
jgi:hypothetical protein